ncbi:MAG: hypothetical protein HYX69_16210 [Planctomycetia bacterium]|nr:hypothetical protein [Planctomycetia bacterium]
MNLRSRILRCLLFGLCLALGVSSGAPPARAETPAAWNRETAAGYLDERAKAWFEFGRANRGQGENKTSCLCCHTVVPYALARPTLRRLAGESQPTEYETRLASETGLRAAHWKQLDTPRFQLPYDFNEDKKKESRGTEAILAALVLASGDRAAGRDVPGDATRQAFDNLWSLQVAEGPRRGAWDWLNFHYEPWESDAAGYFGACIAAVAVGTAPGYYKQGTDAALDEHVERLRSSLRDNLAAQNLYNRAWALWASSALPGIMSKDERQQVVDELFAAQQPDGGWRLASLGDYKRLDGSKQDEKSDGYATGLVTHILRTAGVTTDDPHVAGGQAWLASHQTKKGKWPASSVNKDRNLESHIGQFMSDAATAYAVLALAE